MVSTAKLKTARIDDLLEGQVRVLAARVQTGATRTVVCESPTLHLYFVEKSL